MFLITFPIYSNEYKLYLQNVLCRKLEPKAVCQTLTLKAGLYNCLYPHCPLSSLYKTAKPDRSGQGRGSSPSTSEHVGSSALKGTEPVPGPSCFQSCRLPEGAQLHSLPLEPFLNIYHLCVPMFGRVSQPDGPGAPLNPSQD